MARTRVPDAARASEPGSGATASSTELIAKAEGQKLKTAPGPGRPEKFTPFGVSGRFESPCFQSILLLPAIVAMTQYGTRPSGSLPSRR